MSAPALAAKRFISARRDRIEALATGVLVSATAIYAAQALTNVQTRTFGLGHGSTFAFTIIAVIAMALLRAASFAGFLAVATLVVFNGIPGLNMDNFTTPGSFRVSDIAIGALVVVLASRQRIDRDAVRALRLARGWGLAFALWWILVVVRSVAKGIPASEAALFGRDFLYFAILVPLFVGALGRRRDIYTVLSVIAGGTFFFALAQLAITAFGIHRVGPIHTNLFVHESFSNELGGLHRVYAYMGDAVSAALPLSLGLALIPPRRSLRLVGVVLSVVTTLSVLFAFTRATYLGLTLAFLLVSAIWIHQGSPGSLALRRLSFASVAAILALMISGAYRPLLYSDTATQTVTHRAATTIPDLQHRRGTVQYRYDLQKQMLRVLGSQWLIGLGFLHPKTHQEPTLPDGSIRNTDIGLLNSVMTMGVAGTTLLYAPLLTILAAILRSRRRRSPAVAENEWFFYGLAVWITYAVITSISLVTLFSVPGLVLTAALLGCATRLLAGDGQSQ